MVETIEIKRKIFEVVVSLGERSKKVTRKDKNYFLKDFGDDEEGFRCYVDGLHKCRVSGINVPKVLLFDKKSHIVIVDFLEGETTLSRLMKEDLSDDIFSQLFYMNYYAKKAKISIAFDPENFIISNEKLYYYYGIFTKYSEKWNLEKGQIALWFYTQEFVNYLINKKLPIDKNRANISKGVLNKKIALTVVSNYR